MLFGVRVPVAGHMYIEVEAESDDEAIDKAMATVEIKHIEGWEPMKQFNEGNVCYCPRPWEVSVEELEKDDSDE